jgi:hypothetical protein
VDKPETERLEEYLEVLKLKTPLSEDEIRQRWQQFLIDCPSALLSKERFIELTGQTLGADTDVIAETIFKVEECSRMSETQIRLYKFIYKMFVIYFSSD